MKYKIYSNLLKFIYPLQIIKIKSPLLPLTAFHSSLYRSSKLLKIYIDMFLLRLSLIQIFLKLLVTLQFSAWGYILSTFIFLFFLIFFSLLLFFLFLLLLIKPVISKIHLRIPIIFTRPPYGHSSSHHLNMSFFCNRLYMLSKGIVLFMTLPVAATIKANLSQLLLDISYLDISSFLF